MAVTAIAAVGGIAASASADAGIHVGIVNADGGVWWRTAPDWGTPTRVTGNGIYNGTVVDVDCVVSAGTLPQEYRSTSHLWYHASVFSGPGYGTGWVHDHFMGTPWNAPDRKIDGVPWCNEKPTNGSPSSIIVQPAPSKTGAVYFSPYPLGQFLPSGGELVIPKDDWRTGNQCSNAKMANVPTFDPNAGRAVTTLAGWSLGRVGTFYDLQRFPDRWQTINYVIMIDPGSYDQLRNGCDWTVNANNVLYKWLQANPKAELVIFSGAKTEDRPNPSYVGGKAYYHRGIQEVYFAQIRKDTGIRSRVMVCNYQSDVQRPTDELHQQMFRNFNKYIDQPPLAVGSCPDGGGYWHP